MCKSRFIRLIFLVFLLCSVAGCAGYARSVHTHERGQMYELHVPVSKLAVSIPKKNLVQIKNRQGGGTDSPTYFYFEDGLQHIIISGWFEPEEKFSGVKRFWEQELDAYNRYRNPMPLNVKFDNIANWNAIIYELPNFKYTNTHIRAHWVQAGTWIDIHLSVSTLAPPSIARAQMVSLLNSIQVRE